MNFLVYDSGLSTEHAIRLAKDGNKVKYFSPWNSNFPKFQEYAVGLGLEGIEKELYFFNNADWADVICFFDTGAGDIATFLRNKGYRVFGAGLKGEKLENHRFLGRWIQRNLGLPVQKTWRIKGIINLKDFLKTHRNVLIKHDIFRGDLETFFSPDLESSLQLIRDFENRVGPFGEDMFFMVEESLDGIEPGFDLFFNGNEFVKPFLWGYEFKSAYIGRVVNELPIQLQDIKNKLGSYLKKIDYRGAFSSEAIVTKNKKSFLIDYTARMPYPLSLSYVELIGNFSELIFKVADKKPVSIKPTYKYVAVLPLWSEYSKDHWNEIIFPKENRRDVKMQVISKKNDKYFSIPGLTNIVTLIYSGNTLDEIISEIKKVLDKVHAHDLDSHNAFGSLIHLKEVAQRGEKEFNLSFLN